MMRAANRNGWGRVSGYEVSISGILPVVLQVNEPDQFSDIYEGFQQSAYREDLVRDVTRTVSKVEDLLKDYVPRYPDVGDLIYREAPDDASYQDVYSWDSVSPPVFEDISIPVLDGDSSDVWR